MEVWAVHDERHSKGGLHCAAAARQNGISSGEAWGRLFYQHGAGENQSQIYLYNYVHYDMLYRYRHAVNISRTDRYRVFNMGEIRTFSVKLTGLEPGKYCLRLYKVTKEHGSSYDAWVRMGAPERMNRMERAMLCHSADPEYRVWEQETDPEGSLTVQERLEPHETALIEVEQIL